jgi:very-short-patch-repair endonuclease
VDTSARRPRDVKVAIGTICARLGSRQHGAITHAQLLAAGIGAGAIKHAVKTGGLHRVHRGVYIVGHLALAPGAKEAAALLACGKGAVVSHWSAAQLWGLVDAPPRRVDVTLVGRRCRPRRGIRLHGVSELDRRDVRLKHGLQVTAPARTLIDLAAEAGYDQLERAVAEARALRLVGERDLDAALNRAGTRIGAGRMRAFLRHEGGPVLTRSGGERRMRRLLRAAGLPMPLVNARVEGWEVDFLWPGQRVVVEVDGYPFHAHRRAFERDRRKDLALANAGYHVIRITVRQLLDEPLAVVASIARLLERAGRERH